MQHIDLESSGIKVSIDLSLEPFLEIEAISMIKVGAVVGDIEDLLEDLGSTLRKGHMRHVHIFTLEEVQEAREALNKGLGYRVVKVQRINTF